MYTDLHTDFILTPIRTILEEGINASRSLPSGIESFPISEYYLQSLFLRMTGASEQKMKCIFWQMATDDFDYRYKYQNYQDLGECSTYVSKNTVFKDLIGQITKNNPVFRIQNIWEDFVYDSSTIAEERTKWEAKVKANRQKQIVYIVQKNIDNGKPMSPENISKMTTSIMGKSMNESEFFDHLAANKRKSVIAHLLSDLSGMFTDTNIAEWRTNDLENFKNHSQRVIRACDIAEKNKDGLGLFCGNLVGLYNTVVYSHRNRTAHNTVVYQQNLPALSTMASRDYYLHNYFFRFALLMIMDDVFIRLYSKYMDAIITNKYQG